MKRIVLLIITTLTLGFAAQAQDTFSKGTTTLNLGLGIGGVLFSESYSTVVPPISLGLDYCMVDGLFNGVCSFGVGGYVATTAAHFKGFSGSFFSNTVLGPRGSLHYQFVDKLDTYVSLLLGVAITSVDYGKEFSALGAESKSTSVGFGYGFHLGTRYYLSNNWAIMGEVGYGFTYLTLGATYRF